MNDKILKIGLVMLTVLGVIWMLRKLLLFFFVAMIGLRLL